MSVQTIEPTPDQLAIIQSLERRMRGIFLELAAIGEEVITLKAAGLETREAAEAVVGADNDALEELATLRISRGIPAFSDWWFYRIRVLRPLAMMVEDIPEDDQGGDAVLERAKYRAALAVEGAIAKADPELIELLDRAADRPRGVDANQVPELEDRADLVLTQLVESGWRP